MATTLALRRLSRRLRDLRIASGHTTADPERAKICSRRALARYEAGAVAPSWPTVVALAELYEAPMSLRNQLKTLAMRADEKDWQDKLKGAAPPEFSLLPELEADATAIDVYEPELVNGLFQTAEYGHAVLAASPLIQPERRSVAAALRSHRRERISGDDAPSIRLLLTDGAVRRRIGGKEIHRDQLASLRADAHRRNIAVRYLPDDAGAYGAFLGPFKILRFTDPLDPAVVYTETLQAASYLEGAETVDGYSRAFLSAWRIGVDIDEHPSMAEVDT